MRSGFVLRAVHRLLVALALVPTAAGAVIQCNVLVGAVSVLYNPSLGDVTSSGTYTVTCTRTLASEGPIVNYSLVSDLGLWPQGGNRRVEFAGSLYRYGLFKTGTYVPNDQWGSPPPNAREITGALGFPVGQLSTTSGALPYYLQVAGGQAVGPAGTYTDTVIATLSYTSNSGSGTAPPAPFAVSVTTLTNCTLAVPATLTFNYTSFQAGPSAPSANFTVNCTTGLPYTMSLDGVAQPAPVGVTDDAVNLGYSVQLSAGGGTGAGVNQTYQVLGNMLGGQAGTCAGPAGCSNATATNRTRTLTVNW